MDLKTYRARSMAEALGRVKTELGLDAVILHTRTIKRGGVFGVGAKSFVEITATRDPHVSAAAQRRNGRDEADVPAAIKRKTVDAPHPSAAAGAVTFGARSDAFVAPVTYRAGVDFEPEPPIDFGFEVREEVEAIRGMVAQLLRETQSSRAPEVPSDLIQYYAALIGQDVGSELARQVLERVRGRLESESAAGDPRDEVVRRELRACVGEMLPPAAPVKLTAQDKATVVALVGPTGVGKTTTIAKLAANMKLREKKRVGLITIDTYRIAAVEQLRTYAQILDIPLISVLMPDEMKTAIGRMSDRDLILIDTAGRSQRDEPRIADLARFLAAAEPDQVHLVLSSTAREAAIRESIERFGTIGARHLIFTKLDEAVGLGMLLNVLASVDMRLSYLTDGQAVPDDFQVGSAARVADLIVNGLPPAEKGRPRKRSRTKAGS